MSEVESKMHAFAEELYKNAQAQQQGGEPETPAEPQAKAGKSGKNDGDVIDADFEMVDDDK